MVETSVPSPGPVSPAEESPLARIAGVFASPGPTFASIARRPGWVLPLVICAVLSIAATAAILPRLDYDTAVREGLAKRHRTVPEDRIEQIVETQKRFAGIWYVWAAFAPTVIALVLALVLWVSFKAFGWELAFRQSLGVTAHALLPTIGASMLLIFFGTRLDIIDPGGLADLTHSNPGFLVDRHANPALHSLLGSIDLFSVWIFVLLVIGFAVAAKVSRKKAAVLIGALWAIYVLGKAGLAALFS
jgi:hypothetical protein